MCAAKRSTRQKINDHKDRMITKVDGCLGHLEAIGNLVGNENMQVIKYCVEFAEQFNYMKDALEIWKQQ